MQCLKEGTENEAGVTLTSDSVFFVIEKKDRESELKKRFFFSFESS